MRHPTPPTVFMLPILLFPEFCFWRTTACRASRIGTDATTHGCRDGQSCNRGDDRRIAPVDGSAHKIAALPTRLHHLSGQYQRVSGRAGMDVPCVLLLSVRYPRDQERCASKRHREHGTNERTAVTRERTSAGPLSPANMVFQKRMRLFGWSEWLVVAFCGFFSVARSGSTVAFGKKKK